MDHRRCAAGCRARTLPHAGDGRLRRRRAAARTGRGGHRPHASRTLRVDDTTSICGSIPPPWRASRGRRCGATPISSALRPDDEAAGRRRTEGRHGDAQQGSVEQSVLRRLRRHDRLDEAGADGAWTYDYAAFDRWVRVHGGAGRRQTRSTATRCCRGTTCCTTSDAATGECAGREGRTGPRPPSDEMWRPVPRPISCGHLRRKGVARRRPASPWTSGRPNRWRSPWPSCCRKSRSAAGHRAGRQPRQLQAVIPAAARTSASAASAGGRSRRISSARRAARGR